ncbi:hypothetical protein N7504_010389 [Penicillium tannophilum]|nr:hypothetical protein N7504_010389 [Penicillium tannophilum]
MIFAVGALSLALSGRSELYPVALRFKIRSIQLLRCEISSDESAVNDHNLMVILLLCIFEASDSPDISWSIHFCAAFDMLQANVRKGMGKFTPEVLNFVSQFFRLKEALGGTACGKRSKVNKFPMINDAQISPLLGCSFELIDIISTVTDMSAKAQSLQIQSEQLSEADLLRHRLENLKQVLPSDTPLKVLQAPNGVTNTGNNGLDILHKTSLLMHIATKLYLLTSFRFVGARSSCVRDLVSEAIVIVASFSPSFLHPAHLWPIGSQNLGEP